MQRRRFLAAVAGGAGLSGCVAAAPESPSSGAESSARKSIPLAEQGLPPTICEESVPEEAGVRGISEPATAADWSGIDVPPDYRGVDAAGLEPESVVIGMTEGNRSRAYPLRILHRLEAVNDTFGGPVLVTFCPICNSGMVARRVVDGAPTQFWLSGLLWQPPGIDAAASEQAGRVFGSSRDDPDAATRHSGNLVLVDDSTGSYWSQLLASAICGPEAGTELDVVPAIATTWGEWQETHPATDVLLPPPYSTPIR